MTHHYAAARKERQHERVMRQFVMDITLNANLHRCANAGYRREKRFWRSRQRRPARPELARIAAPATVPASGKGMPTKMPARTPFSIAAGRESRPYRVCKW